MLDHLEQRKICVLNVTTLGIAKLTIQHYTMFSVCFLNHPGDIMREKSAGVLSVKECPFDILQT